MVRDFVFPDDVDVLDYLERLSHRGCLCDKLPHTFTPHVHPTRVACDSCITYDELYPSSTTVKFVTLPIDEIPTEK